MTTLPIDASLPYYASQGPMTDPGEHARLLDGLPRDLPALCRAVRGLVIHYRSPALGDALLATRGDEVRTRRISGMLARLHELDPSPLVLARPAERRLIGCCRDAAALVCAALRHAGVPARVRVGFAHYLEPDLCIDHWVAEWWDDARQQWILVDAEQDGLVSGSRGMVFDPCDVPRDQFLVAGWVWDACRTDREDPNLFGYDATATGMGVVRSNLLHDVACLNKMELTPWDFWGIGLTDVAQLSPDDLALLDRVAALTQAGAAGFHSLRDLYAHDTRLRVPATVTSYGLSDETMEVALA